MQWHIIDTYNTAILYTSTCCYRNIFSPKISWSCMFLHERMNFNWIKVNDEYEYPDVLRELPYRICKFLFLKFPCCIKRVRKSKELELCGIIFKNMHTVDLFMDSFTSCSTTKCGFDFEVNCYWLKTEELVQHIWNTLPKIYCDPAELRFLH